MGNTIHLGMPLLVNLGINVTESACEVADVSVRVGLGIRANVCACGSFVLPV